VSAERQRQQVGIWIANQAILRRIVRRLGLEMLFSQCFRGMFRVPWDVHASGIFFSRFFDFASARISSASISAPERLPFGTLGTLGGLLQLKL